MKRLAKALLTTTLAAGMLWLAPAAQADRYYDYAHDEDDGWSHHDRGRHLGYYRHHRAPREVIVIRRYDPVPPRVVEHHDHVVERPVVVHESYPRHGRRYPRHEYQSATPVILGGILGGVVGNRMGKGHGRDIATVAGVLLGGSIGRDLAHHH